MPNIVVASVSWYTNTPLLVGIVAFVGTLLGALIGAVTNYFIARQKQKLDDRKDALEVKRAARLIQMELLLGFGTIQDTVSQRRYNMSKADNSNWLKYAHVLAPVLSDDEWVKICVAETSFELILSMRKMAHDNGRENDDLGDLAEAFKRDIANMDAGLDSLKKWHQD
jgi:uncharacterized membrane protein YccC